MHERDQLLDPLKCLLARCSEGRGATGIISGAVGFGKTALLDTFAEQAAARGHTVLTAVASRAESGFPYSVVAQLFQSALSAGADAPQGTTALLDLLSDPAAAPSRVMHAAHRLLALLSAERPVVLCVDDVQHSDPQSLECLLYLIRRCRPIPVVIVLTYGVTGMAERQSALAELMCRPGVHHLRLGALDEQDVAATVADRFDEATAERCAPQIARASGGNPLLVQALLSDRSTADADPDDTDAELVAGLAFREASAACVHRSGADALLVARGIAMIDGAASLSLLWELVGLEEWAVVSALKLLRESRLITGLRFRHPAIRAAVLDDIPPAERIRLHQRAGLLLRGHGAPAMVVAPHLLAGGFPREDWATRLLMDAARQALTTDDVPLAARCLQLAETGCTDEEQRRRIQTTLARVMWRDRPEAADRLLLNLATPAKTAELPGVASIKVAHTLLMRGMVDDAVEILRRVFHAQSGDCAALALEVAVARLWLASTYPGVSTLLEPELEPALVPHRTPAQAIGQPRLTSNHALWVVLTKGADDTLVAETERLLQNTPVDDDTIHTHVSAVMTLVYADRLKAAETRCARLQAAIADRRSPTWSALLTSVQALIALRQGALPTAAETAEAALASMTEEAWGVEIGLPLATAIEAHTAIGDHAAAGALVNKPVPEAMLQTRFGLHYLYARGRHHLATGYLDAALADFTLCGKKARDWALDCAALAPWRIGLVECWLQRGQRERAVKIADEHLASVGEAPARTQGMALRAQAATRPPSQRLEILGRALDLLQSVGDRYEVALTLADLGRAHQRHSATGQARLIVRQAWHTANECGADALQSSLRPKPSGTVPAQPRSLHRAEGKKAGLLSEAELRVTSLAAQGYSNREISNKLYITVSTVEQHLTRVYRKLNIRHRHELQATFAS
ncbi:AAA family ATPase [Streptomyces sp. NPDC051921]|uniref:helix-turn-helix transcriptional regulator n=1 Tax=Streptomyces sp. NPDC051921 TaxID=3155806 RepID=UPI003447D4BC